MTTGSGGTALEKVLDIAMQDSGGGGGAHVIVFGNEKGGSGKSTTAMHVAVALLKLKRSVGIMDLDGRQQTLTRYVENRRDFCAANGIRLPMPRHHVIERSTLGDAEAAKLDERERFEATLSNLRAAHDFVIIDSPGSDTYLARLGHAAADTLVTPLNDSFVDFDLLARIDADTYRIKGPSLYAELVWESRKQRMIRDRKSIDWVVMRNRVSSVDARNKRRVGEVLEALAKRIGFRLAPGFGERVIFRELFPTGLTLLDLTDPAADMKLTMSHLAARQEVRDLVVTLDLPGLEGVAASL